MAESRVAIYGAMSANVAIAVTKFIVAGWTGSSAMLSEAIHSLVDTANSALLLLGVHRSQGKASAEHPYGPGKELYFWSLIVGVMIFGVGGGISFYEGLLRVRHPRPLEDPHWIYIVLAVAAVFEATSFTVALRQFSRERGSIPFWKALHTSKDPATYTVLAEDSAALTGLAIAAAGVFFSHRLQMPRLDGVASMAIGVLLACVAVLLIRESRGLLVGEGVRPDVADGIRRIALAEESVARAGRVLSMFIGPDDVLVTLDLGFDPSVSAAEVAESIGRIEDEIRRRYPKINRIYLEPTGACQEPGRCV